MPQGTPFHILTLQDLAQDAVLTLCALEAVELAAGGGASEFRLLALGANRTNRHGVARVELSAETARRLVSWFRGLGRKLAIDFEHQTFRRTRPDGLAPAAGWIGGLELRADGLYATGVEWTDEARELIRAGKYRYISPVIFWADEARTRIAALGPPALTNDPALTDLPMLAATGGTPVPHEPGPHGTTGGTPVPQGPHADDALALAAGLMALGLALEQAGSSAAVVSAQIETALSEVNLPQVAAALGLPESSSRETVMREFKRLLAAGGAAGGASDGAGGGGPTVPASSTAPPTPFRAIAAELLPAEQAAGVSDQAGLVTALRAQVETLRARASAADANAAALTALQADFKALRARADEAEFRQLVDGGAGKGRITPAMEPAWKTLFMSDREQFDALLNGLPVLASGTSAFAAGHRRDAGATGAGATGNKHPFVAEAEKLAGERRIGIGDALSAVAREKPELYTAFKATI